MNHALDSVTKDLAHKGWDDVRAVMHRHLNLLWLAEGDTESLGDHAQRVALSCLGSAIFNYLLLISMETPDSIPVGLSNITLLLPSIAEQVKDRCERRAAEKEEEEHG